MATVTPDIVLAKGRHWPLHDRILLSDRTGTFPIAYGQASLETQRRSEGEAD